MDQKGKLVKNRTKNNAKRQKLSEKRTTKKHAENNTKQSTNDKRQKILKKKEERKCPALRVNVQALVDCMAHTFKMQKFSQKDIWSLRCSCRYFDAIVKMNCRQIIQAKLDHQYWSTGNKLAVINIYMSSVDALYEVLEIDDTQEYECSNDFPHCLSLKCYDVPISLEYIHVYTQHKLESDKIYDICCCGKPAVCLIHTLNDKEISCSHATTECHIWKCPCNVRFRVSRAVKDKTPKYCHVTEW